MDLNNITCGYFIERKKRHCRMTVGKNSKFCGEHTEGPRTPCPLDPKHSCSVNHLEKHLRKCRAKKVQTFDYIVPAINTSEHHEKLDTVTLADLSESELTSLIARIESVCESIPPTQTSIECHDSLNESLAASDCGVKARKHLLQNASLLGNLEKFGLLKEGMTFIEFGAGRGQFSYHIGNLLAEKGCKLMLIDRASMRHKLDNKLKDFSKLEIVRIRADIADLDLAPLLSKEAQIVGICKHLCGEGTDLTLQCLLRTITSGIPLAGILLSPCCHHRCTWRNFLGRESLEKWGFPARIFPALCGISSWATCGSGRPRELSSLPDERVKNGLDQPARERIGHLAKMVLNYARLEHVEKFGLKGWLMYYIGRDVSPENVCYMAVPCKS